MVCIMEKSSDKKGEPISTRLDSDADIIIREMAAKDDRTPAYMMRKIVQDWLIEHGYLTRTGKKKSQDA